jgi:phosphotransferase system HPr (HPr) family protein
MQKLRMEITNPTGLHTRPGTEFVRLAKTFESSVEIQKGDKTANAKSLIKMLKIGISQGDVIEIAVEGPDEEQAMPALRDYIANLKD